jgi:hypothetical protein
MAMCSNQYEYVERVSFSPDCRADLVIDSHIQNEEELSYDDWKDI